MWTPSDHNRDEDHSSMYISSHWVPCKHHLMTCVGGIGRDMVMMVVVSVNVRDKFTIGCQVCMVCHVWKSHANVLILDCAVVRTSATVRDLEFPPSLHLQDLGSVGIDGRSHESILHVPVHEIPQGSHFRFRQRVHMSAGNAVISRDHLYVGVNQPVTRVDVLIHRCVHILDVVIPHRVVNSVSIHVVEERWMWRIRW